MASFHWYAGPAAIACASLLVAFLIRRRSRAGAGANAAGSRKDALEMECTVCHKHLVFGTSELFPLTGTEVALVVRTQPPLVGKKLFEYVCPYCDASHCFVIDRQKYKWVAVNSYNPQVLTTNCMECGKSIQRPPWPKGQYDEQVHAVPQMRDEYGLICSRCGARCCVACCRKVTPKATLPFLCPRCRRGPVHQFLHF